MLHNHSIRIKERKLKTIKCDALVEIMEHRFRCWDKQGDRPIRLRNERSSCGTNRRYHTNSAFFSIGSSDFVAIVPAWFEAIDEQVFISIVILFSLQSKWVTVNLKITQLFIILVTVQKMEEYILLKLVPFTWSHVHTYLKTTVLTCYIVRFARRSEIE